MDENTAEYSISWQGTVTGPYSIKEIRSMLKSGRINSLYRIKVEGEWLMLRDYLAQIDRAQRDADTSASRDSAINYESSKSQHLDARIPKVLPEIDSSVRTEFVATNEQEIAAKEKWKPSNPQEKKSFQKSIESHNLFSKIINVRALLDSLADGSTIRHTFGTLLKAYAIISGLILFYAWCQFFQLLNVLTFTQGLVLLIWQIFLIFASFVCLKAVFLRGGDISRLPDSDFIITPIISIIITLHGEIAFIFLAIMSLPASLVIWFSVNFVFPIENVGQEKGAMMTFLGCWFVGFLLYCITRCIREWIMAIFSIANNVDLIRRDKNI